MDEDNKSSGCGCICGFAFFTLCFIIGIVKKADPISFLVTMCLAFWISCIFLSDDK